MKRFRTLVLGLLAAVMLAGCFPAAVVGVGAGALVYTDRRPTETVLTDEGIEIRSGNRIREAFADRVHVNVASYNRTVLLTGEVPDAATRARVAKLVSGVPNVKAIHNELAVAGVSSLTSRSNDLMITSRIKARFIDAGRVSANHVKVVSERGVVHLMGKVTLQEAAAAVEIARTTSGVQRVIRLFEIISAEEARRLDPQPPAGGQTQAHQPTP